MYYYNSKQQPISEYYKTCKEHFELKNRFELSITVINYAYHVKSLKIVKQL